MSEATKTDRPLPVLSSEGLGPTPPLLERLNELPALPTPWVCVRDNDDELVSVWRAFQMRDYARACMCPLLAEIAALREQLASFTPLRARGVVDADDNLDCWDTDPFEICHDHVAALNEKDPGAMWRVVELFGRDLGPNVEFSGVPAGHSSSQPAGGTSAGTQG